MITLPDLKRCALYTRKSTEEGLEQRFNSLDAQREACEAFVKSQTHEGWQAVDTHYDDGGFSGGSMARPGLQQLLKDIADGKIDVVVVYKIDRLTRSLVDFSRMVELFDKHQVSFVSVTQSFNTTSSMGRLTLNVLLSFAQYERELTGERIRDKIAASKARGLWLGGNPPLGYDAPVGDTRVLEINVDEAERVRLIFSRYLEMQSVHKLCAWLNRQGITPKQWVTAAGKRMGAHAFSRSSLFYLLRNPVYVGKIRHKGLTHEGGHKPIVDPVIFEHVQSDLEKVVRRDQASGGKAAKASLTGRLFDAVGEPMSPTFSRGRKGKVYRYYVSTSLQKGGKASTDTDLIQRVPAEKFELQIAQAILRLCPTELEPLKVVDRVDLARGIISLRVHRKHCDGIEMRLESGETCARDTARSNFVRITIPLRLRNLRGSKVVELAAQPAARPDPALINALKRAHSLVKLDAYRLPVCDASPSSSYDRRILQLAFLAPDIQDSILAGQQPPKLTLSKLLAKPLPISWHEQRSLLSA